MATYSSEEVRLNYPAEKVFEKLSNMENLRSLLAKVPASSIPDDKRQMFESLDITPDSITIPGGPVGALKLRMSERKAPSLVKLSGEGTPVPLDVLLHITPDGEGVCRARIDLDIAIPAMLKPMVNGPLTQMTSQMGDVLRHLTLS